MDPNATVVSALIQAASLVSRLRDPDRATDAASAEADLALARGVVAAAEDTDGFPGQVTPRLAKALAQALLHAHRAAGLAMRFEHARALRDELRAYVEAEDPSLVAYLVTALSDAHHWALGVRDPETASELRDEAARLWALPDCCPTTSATYARMIIEALRGAVRHGQTRDEERFWRQLETVRADPAAAAVIESARTVLRALQRREGPRGN